MIPFIGTGVGRSGTMWTSRLFCELGWWCGHESQFNEVRSGPLELPDVSWLAVPFLQDLPRQTPVLRIVRNPYLVVQSAMREKFLTDEPTGFDQFVARHRPWILQAPDRLGRIIRWAAEWDRPVDEVDHLVIHPAADSVSGLARAVTYATGWSVSPSKVAEAVRRISADGIPNSNRGGTESVSASQILDHEEGWRIAIRAERWNYVVPGRDTDPRTEPAA